MASPVEPVSPEELKTIFRMSEDGALIRLNRKRAKERSDTLCWDGYRRVQIGSRSAAAHRVCWALHYGYWPKLCLDHIDGNRSNNRIENLREAQTWQNAGNRKPTSGKPLKGTTWNKSANKFQAQIQGRYLGVFKTEQEAAAAYDEAAKSSYGEFAKTNFGATHESSR